MTDLSIEALRRASLAVLRERTAAERALQDVDPASDEAHDLSDELGEMIMVQSELYEACTKLQAATGDAGPSWEELLAAAAAY